MCYEMFVLICHHSGTCLIRILCPKKVKKSKKDTKSKVSERNFVNGKILTLITKLWQFQDPVRYKIEEKKKGDKRICRLFIL